MSEYIVETGVREHGAYYRTHEKIVRCRDCKWCMAYAKATYCDRFAHELPEVTLDGFCAWGERREP